MEYVRVSSSADGESHVEEVAVPLHSLDFAPAAAYGFLSSPPGWSGDWHPTPRRQLVFYLAGEVEAEASDGEVRRFGPGSVTLVEDTHGQGHRSRVVGADAVRLAVVQLPD